ncbi:hypothetical protein Golax_022744, partial [Gossypium laxum]|nr:hypothetical protein [Gossypium laxum]
QYRLRQFIPATQGWFIASSHIRVESRRQLIDRGTPASSPVQKLEAEKLRKGNNKAEEDLDSLKTDYKKLHTSIRTAGLGKTSEQWR